VKVLHLIDSAGVYGAEQVLLNLQSELLVQGAEPILGSLRLPGEPEKAIEREARLRGIPVWPFAARRGLDRAAFRRITEFAVKEGVDIIHSHGYKANTLTAVFGSTMFDGPIVATLHGWTSTSPLKRMWWYEAFERQCIGRFDAVVAVHGDMADLRKVSHRLAGRLVVIPNGISAVPPFVIDSSDPLLARIKQFCSRAPTIIAAGRLSREKAFGNLIDALALLHRDGLPVQLVIAGDGALRQVLAERAAELRLADHVLFAGFVANVAALFHLFQVYALPSTREGLPIVLLEAMRAGLPVVASTVGGIPEVLGHGECGVLVPPGDVVRLADGLRSVLAAPEAGRELGQRGRMRFNAKYTVAGMTKAYLDLYGRVVQARCPSRVPA
jgi:glycosyltransferase involved in cell wall biosynthesis